MKKRKGNFEIIIIVAVILFALTYLFLKNTDKINYKVPKLGTLKIDKIEKIVITKGDRKVVLKKNEGDWSVEGDEGYKTDSDILKKVIESVSELKLTTLVSKSKNYFKYELDEKRKINVKVFIANKMIREFDIGKIASTYDHTNVKIAKDNNVYHSQGSLRSIFDKSLDDFRDKNVFTIDRSQTNKIIFIINNKEYTFNKTVLAIKKGEDGKKDGDKSQKTVTEWTLNGKKVDNSKVNSILSILMNIECDKYDYSNSDVFSNDPLFTLKLEGSVEDYIKVYNLKNKDDDIYPVKTSQSKYNFYVKKYKIDNFFKTLKELI